MNPTLALTQPYLTLPLPLPLPYHTIPPGGDSAPPPVALQQPSNLALAPPQVTYPPCSLSVIIYPPPYQNILNIPPPSHYYIPPLYHNIPSLSVIIYPPSLSSYTLPLCHHIPPSPSNLALALSPAVVHLEKFLSLFGAWRMQWGWR